MTVGYREKVAYLLAQPDPVARDRALALLSRMPTTSGSGTPASVRTQAVFNRPATGVSFPLNRKTTQQAITLMPLTDLEPRQEYVPVQGLASYIARPRRDPPDVARVKMRDGKTRLFVQEGHTRLGAGVLRGDATMPMRIWDFEQNDSGGFDPVIRGRHSIGIRHRDKLRSMADTINLPDIADVSFPTLIGAIPAKRKKRKPVQYKGVKLSRAPMQFEVKVLALTEIPPRLDAAVLELQQPHAPLASTLGDIVRYGEIQALRELVRQGAPTSILVSPPACVAAVQALVSQVEAARTQDLAGVRQHCSVQLERRRISPQRREMLAHELADRSTPGIFKRHAKRAVNRGFSLGRALVIAHYRRSREAFDLKSRFDKLDDGDIWVDAVIQTAVMDTNTCDDCAEVDGEQMELGDDRQEELHPPYVMCQGGDNCRCVQIALLSDGSEIDVDEVPDDAYPTEEEDF